MENEEKKIEIYGKCEKMLNEYNEHFKINVYLKNLNEEPLGRCEFILKYVEKFHRLFIDYLVVYKCVPPDAWKNYILLEITGLEEQSQLKFALERLDNHLKERPKLIVKGKVRNDRKKIIRQIQERSAIRSQESRAKTS